MSEILDINGNPTGLVERVLYRIQNSERAQLIQAHHGTNPNGDYNVSAAQPANGGSEWHRDHECVWSFHAVPATNHRKYYIVTSGKFLHAAHGNSYQTNDKRSHEVNGLGKVGGSEWHKNGPESQWQFEDRGSRNFRISTSHKALWFPGNNKHNDVRGLNRENNNGHDWQFNSLECSWKIIPVLGMYESKVDNFSFQSPFPLDGPIDGLSPDVFFNHKFNNPTPPDGSEGVTVNQKFSHKETYTEDTTVSFSSTNSITLSSKASVGVEGKVPGLGSITATVETGADLANSLTNGNSCTITKTNEQVWESSIAIPPGSSGLVTVFYYTGEFNVDFVADVTLKARVKIAPREWASTAAPTFEYAAGDMLKAALKDGGFDKPDSQVTYMDGTAKFQEGGTMKGAGGFTLHVNVKYDENSTKAVITSNTFS